VGDAGGAAADAGGAAAEAGGVADGLCQVGETSVRIVAIVRLTADPAYRAV